MVLCLSKNLDSAFPNNDGPYAFSTGLHFTKYKGPVGKDMRILEAPLRRYCGMYISLSDDKHQKVRDRSKKHAGNPRQIQSKTKCSPRQKSV